jgi:hypothetical protein
MKCYWCEKPAKKWDYRELDGEVVHKIPSCTECFFKDTFFLRLKYRR